MELACAIKLNAGPVMPGAAARVVAVSSNASTSKTSNRDFEIIIFVFVAFIAALLVDVDLGHEPAKIFSVIGKVVEIRGVQIEHAARGILRCIAGIQNHVERLAPA